MKGLDYLGLGSKACDIDMMIRVTPKDWAVGAFDGTTGDARFGDAIPALRKFCKRGIAAIRVHLWYNKAHTICPMEIIQKRAPLYEKIAKEYPTKIMYLSHSCEHNEKSQAEVQKRIDLIKKLAPSCIPVNSIWQGTLSSDEDTINEIHRIDVRPIYRYIISTDGIDIYNINANKYRRQHRKAEILFLWGTRFNLAEAHNTLPPQNRTAAPDEKYIRAIIRLACPEGKPPTPTFKGKIVPFAKPLLYKSFAEDMEGKNIRDNKPMTITPSDAKVLSVVTYTGKEIAQFRFFGGYPPNLERHYSGTGSNLYGYEIAVKARKASGFEFVWFRDGNTYYGPVNPAFRRPWYQNG